MRVKSIKWYIFITFIFNGVIVIVLFCNVLLCKIQHRVSWWRLYFKLVHFNHLVASYWWWLIMSLQRKKIGCSNISWDSALLSDSKSKHRSLLPYTNLSCCLMNYSYLIAFKSADFFSELYNKNYRKSTALRWPVSELNQQSFSQCGNLIELNFL